MKHVKEAPVALCEVHQVDVGVNNHNLHVLALEL